MTGGDVLFIVRERQRRATMPRPVIVKRDIDLQAVYAAMRQRKPNVLFKGNTWQVSSHLLHAA